MKKTTTRRTATATKAVATVCHQGPTHQSGNSGPRQPSKDATRLLAEKVLIAQQAFKYGVAELCEELANRFAENATAAPESRTLASNSVDATSQEEILRASSLSELAYLTVLTTAKLRPWTDESIAVVVENAYLSAGLEEEAARSERALDLFREGRRGAAGSDEISLRLNHARAVFALQHFGEGCKDIAERKARLTQR